MVIFRSGGPEALPHYLLPSTCQWGGDGLFGLYCVFADTGAFAGLDWKPGREVVTVRPKWSFSDRAAPKLCLIICFHLLANGAEMVYLDCTVYLLTLEPLLASIGSQDEKL